MFSELFQLLGESFQLIVWAHPEPEIRTTKSKKIVFINTSISKDFSVNTLKLT